MEAKRASRRRKRAAKRGAWQSTWCISQEGIQSAQPKKSHTAIVRCQRGSATLAEDLAESSREQNEKHAVFALPGPSLSGSGVMSEAAPRKNMATGQTGLFVGLKSLPQLVFRWMLDSQFCRVQLNLKIGEGQGTVSLIASTLEKSQLRWKRSRQSDYLVACMTLANTARAHGDRYRKVAQSFSSPRRARSSATQPPRPHNVAIPVVLCSQLSGRQCLYGKARQSRKNHGGKTRLIEWIGR